MRCFGRPAGGAFCYALKVHERPYTLLLLLLLTVFAASCAPAGDIRSAERIGDVVPPQFRLVEGQTRIERFDPPGAGSLVAVVVGTSVYNPNDFAVKVSRIDYTVMLEGRQVEKGTLELDMFLNAEGTAPLAFEIETLLEDRPDLLREVVRAFAGDPLEFAIEGELTFNSLAYQFRTNNRPLVEGATLSRETVETPTLRLVEPESDAYLLAPEVPVVRLVLSIRNPGDVGYFLYGKDLSLSLAGHSVAMDDLTPVPVAAGSSTRMDIIFYPQRGDLSEEGRAALDAALSGIPTTVELTGRLSMDVLGVDAFAVPDGWRVVGFIHRGDR